MKLVRLSKNQIGLVFNKGNYNRIITDGKFWIGFLESIKIYDMTSNFVVPVELALLQHDKSLMSRLNVIDVLDNEIVIVKRKGIFECVLSAGQYTFWNTIIERSFVKIDLNELKISGNFDKNLLAKPALMRFSRSFTVEPYEKALLMVDGKYEGDLKVGLHYFWRNNISVQVLKVDTRQKQIEISGQELLTKDKAGLRVNFSAQYHVVDINKALLENTNFEKQLYTLIQLALREYVGQYTLDELLANKETVNEKVIAKVKNESKSLGVTLTFTGIRDIILPGDVKEIMKDVLVAQKRAQANNIMRREETASTRSLLNTAKLMEDNEMLMKLKEMEYTEKMMSNIMEKVKEINISSGDNIIKQLRETFA